MKSIAKVLCSSRCILADVTAGQERRCAKFCKVEKGVSSHLIRKKGYPSISKKLWGGALWSPSYFSGSCGGAPIAVIRQYIEQQKTPD
jgi:putative transposase